MNIFRQFRSFAIIILLVVLSLLGFDLAAPGVVQAASTDCTSSGPTSKAYTVNVCFTSPVSSSTTLTGDVTITATGKVSNSTTGIQRMVFYLDGTYLLTDYQSPYTFTLPTTQWADGSYALSAEVLLRDGFTSQQASVTVQFKNGVNAPPVNKGHFQPTSGRPANGAPFVVAAAGDGASGENNAEKVTALISSINPNLFLYLGDVYEKGSVSEFYNWYGNGGTNFSAFRAITDPTIGNHEYTAGPPTGYFNYWDNIPNFYSFDAGGWHFVSLNSNYYSIGVDGKSSQYIWLSQDLASHANACTMVYYHHPLFNIGPEGETTNMAEIWALMAKDGVSIVLNGHDHDYQRWVPLNGTGQPSPSGITEFVAGGAGHGLQTFTKTDSRVAYSNDMNPTAFGVLKFILHPNGADFSYINSSKAILDSGTIPCNKASAPQGQAPGTPTGLVAKANSETQVNLDWQASADASGVSGYTIYRDGSVLTTVPGNTLTYADRTVAPGTSYSYTVDAFDLTGGHSAPSSPVSAATPANPTSPAKVTVAASTATPAESATPTHEATSMAKLTPTQADASSLPANPINLPGSGMLVIGGLVVLALIGIFLFLRRHM